MSEFNEREITDEMINEVWDFYKKTFKEYYQPRKFSGKRKNKIKQRLKSFAIDEIKNSLIAIKDNDYMLGNNKNNMFYAKPEYCFRSDEKTEEWLNKYVNDILPKKEDKLVEKNINHLKDKELVDFYNRVFNENVKYEKLSDDIKKIISNASQKFSDIELEFAFNRIRSKLKKRNISESERWFATNIRYIMKPNVIKRNQKNWDDTRDKLINGEVDLEDINYLYNEIVNKFRIMDYKKYLKTDYWKEFSKKARKHYNNKCQLCGEEQEKLNVHHNNYKNRGKETFDDVILLCDNCHYRFHELDLGDRQ